MHIEFYEKPGCINNTKQKKLLEQHGHTIAAHSLLTEAWTPKSLRPFFDGLPVQAWFNMTAPRIKSGEVVPKDYDEQTALEAMVADPLLIRRPLISVGDNKVCGFDHDFVKNLINNVDASQLTVCPKNDNSCD